MVQKTVKRSLFLHMTFLVHITVDTAWLLSACAYKIEQQGNMRLTVSVRLIEREGGACDQVHACISRIEGVKLQDRGRVHYGEHRSRISHI